MAERKYRRGAGIFRRRNQAGTHRCFPALLPYLNLFLNQMNGRKAGSRTISIRGEAYQEFWTTFLEKLKERVPGMTNAKKGLPQSWCSIDAGRTGFAYAIAFKSKGRLSVEVYIDTGEREKNKQFFDQLYEQKDDIEKDHYCPPDPDATARRTNCAGRGHRPVRLIAVNRPEI